MLTHFLLLFLTFPSLCVRGGGWREVWGRGGCVDTSIYLPAPSLLMGRLFAGEVEAGEGGGKKKEVWPGPLCPGKPAPCRKQSIPLNTPPQLITSRKEIVKAQPAGAFALETEGHSSPAHHWGGRREPLRHLALYLPAALTNWRRALPAQDNMTNGASCQDLNTHTCFPFLACLRAPAARRPRRPGDAPEAGCPLGRLRRQSPSAGRPRLLITSPCALPPADKPGLCQACREPRPGAPRPGAGSPADMARLPRCQPRGAREAGHRVPEEGFGGGGEGRD